KVLDLPDIQLEKNTKIEPFSENVFLFFFEKEENFVYFPSQHKYQCILEGVAGGERLKSIFGYDQLISKMNTNTQTIGYVLLENIDGKYKIKIN
ncbi:1102_t:CDS:1, partial [Entrophospora sp. SA101]